jgi:HopA1 effector protein family
MLQTASSSLETLRAIASDIEISLDFCIRHPHFEKFALASDIVVRFQRNPVELRQKYYSLLLRNFIFGIYFNASLQNILSKPPSRVTGIYALHHNLENNSILGIDEELRQQLHEHNHSIGYYDSGWEVLRREPDASLAVIKSGLTMYADSNYLDKNALVSKPGDYISLWLPKNRLQNGYYIAVSNFGQPEYGISEDFGLTRIYFNIDVKGAVPLIDNLTIALNQQEIPFSFHVLCHPAAFGRYDSCILEFSKQDFLTIHKILQEIYTQHQLYFHTEIPLFTKYLAPGVGVAEEPGYTNKRESFGMNRCQIIANALLNAWQKGEKSVEAKMQAIEDSFNKAGINLEYPHLNHDSEDIYIPLS